ncbi:MULTISPECIES: hypothetical protein [unclassified Tessaracoccus]|uniref:hypothetical protein n=1 Tax=unclassified Tessaracoccus TaxID=2635419 RepID=UPI001600F167|nr:MULTISPECIES: hypothetical protein [unclassified Tessaracoccus]MBB1513923.1 hypothetical protein [Tessaracoccus sp. MC1627]MBB1516217.1 hypothetical protein [Tessaracoccus sp. MC1679]
MGNSPSENAPEGPSRTDDGMLVLSYLLSGIIFYGGLGWVGDYLLHTSWLLPLGLILGLVTSIYLIIKRYGSGT